ncbi:hypothetical protein NLJ89_g3991 [Agrocybe chaxingu]|uniref:Uncharacterized protein n=1 Tax=Agrocybe chaxingu TaxID=84603 RepID=A0A9W8K3X5_9AGAR|nr:hypothetical protein NLJ89_g3991 [Agrocybe chaxingu]
MRNEQGGATVTEPEGAREEADFAHKPPASQRLEEGVEPDVEMGDDTFRFPSARDEYFKAPTFAYENPHLDMTQRGDKPGPKQLPVATATPFTSGLFPRAVIPFDDLLANLDMALQTQIKENPENFLAVVPFGAGNKFFKANPDVNKRVRDFVATLGYNNNGLSVHKAEPQDKPSDKRDFEKPWAMILRANDPDLCSYLVWQQTFAIDRTLAFNIVPFDKNLKPWVIANYCGDAVANNADERRTALVAIKQKLWTDANFRKIADRLMAQQGISGNLNKRVYMATSSFDLTFIDTNNAGGDLAPIWQLTGKPLTNDKDDHREYLAAIRNVTVYVNMNKLKLDKRVVQCVGCKAPTHPGHKCSFPDHPTEAEVGSPAEGVLEEAAEIETIKEVEVVEVEIEAAVVAGPL